MVYEELDDIRFEEIFEHDKTNLTDENDLDLYERENDSVFVEGIKQFYEQKY